MNKSENTRPAGGTARRATTETTACIRGFLQLVAGMSLIGAVFQEGVIIAYGGGRNGKSTYFNALGTVLGDYTGSIDIKVITTDRANKGASLATLRGRRLVITGELEEHQRLSVLLYPTQRGAATPTDTNKTPS